MTHKCTCGTGEGLGHHEVSCMIHRNYAPGQQSLGDTKCQNEGCVNFSTLSVFPSNCSNLGQTLSELHLCHLFTTAHTTSIPVAELEELRKDAQRLTEIKTKWQKQELDLAKREGALMEKEFSHPAELQSLHAKIKELEGDKERLDWLADECYLPKDHPEGGVFMVVDEKSLSFGSYTGRTEEDRTAVREAIDSARK